MTKFTRLDRLGTKSQIVVRKEYRKALGLKPGSLLHSKLVGKRIVYEPFDFEKEMQRVEKIAHMIGKKIPKEINSVDIIRKERE
jgi:bifunctional DNA-binding transcriptional regulator/antitoxin component of YhaV-PrlF toxin-antitoxin module